MRTDTCMHILHVCAPHAQTLEERERYLRQLEADQAEGVSNGAPSRQGVLAAPVASFVIKARSRDGAKVFINVCTSDKARCFAGIDSGRLQYHFAAVSASAKGHSEGARANGAPCTRRLSPAARQTGNGVCRRRSARRCAWARTRPARRAACGTCPCTPARATRPWQALSTRWVLLQLG